MKIGFVSDLHADNHALSIPNYMKRLIIDLAGQVVRNKIDALLILGDLADSSAYINGFVDGLRALTGPEVKIAYLFGNHCYYGETLWPWTPKGVGFDFDDQSTLLDRSVLNLGEARILGCTLWTDLAKGTHANECRKRLRDFEYIFSAPEREIDSAFRPIQPEDYLAAHKLDLAWLKRELATPFDGITIVATHHAPSFRSVSIKNAGSSISGGFCVDLEEMILEHEPALWLHGHLHEEVDYFVGRTHVASNPWGSRREIMTSRLFPSLRVANIHDRTVHLERTL